MIGLGFAGTGAVVFLVPGGLMRAPSRANLPVAPAGLSNDQPSGVFAVESIRELSVVASSAYGCVFPSPVAWSTRSRAVAPAECETGSGWLWTFIGVIDEGSIERLSSAKTRPKTWSMTHLSTDE
jgi:hypothetical protein